jgi:hypothetical protein
LRKRVGRRERRVAARQHAPVEQLGQAFDVEHRDAAGREFDLESLRRREADAHAGHHRGGAARVALVGHDALAHEVFDALADVLCPRRGRIDHVHGVSSECGSKDCSAPVPAASGDGGPVMQRIAG